MTIFTHKGEIKKFLPLLLSVIVGAGIILFIRMAAPGQLGEYIFAVLVLAYSFSYMALTINILGRGGENLITVTPSQNRFGHGLIWLVLILLYTSVVIWQCFLNNDTSFASGLRHTSLIILWLTIGISTVFVWTERWFIRTDGIIFKNKFFPWEKIVDFSWDKEFPRALTLQVKKSFLSQEKIYLVLPDDKQKDVISHLQAKIL